MRFLGLIFFILSANVAGFAQNFELGSLPQATMSINIKDVTFNSNIQSRNIFFQQDDFDYSYDLTDFTFTCSKKIMGQYTILGGYMFRIEQSNLTHRFLQQISRNKRLNRGKVGLRFRVDQTFGNEPFEFRARFRLAFEQPLAGNVLNDRELYLKYSFENIHGFSNGLYDLDLRFLYFLGYRINDGNRIEFGVDYRLDKFTYSDLNQTLWLAVNYYYAFE
ncbi:MAG: DUF2490 domain-containing protein [Flavobacteriales bacterium]|nr:DUF2490 domain-containing protein [Flavobacteriales bacterium]